MSGQPAVSWKHVVLGMVSVLAVAAAVAVTAFWTRPVRRAVAAYTALITAANRGDLDAARRLCSNRYLKTHQLVPAQEGGLVGLPRNIHTNFRAWRQGQHVWLCPSNRDRFGPVYQFVREGETWKFDGPVGLLRGHGEFVPMPDLIEPAARLPAPGESPAAADP